MDGNKNKKKKTLMVSIVVATACAAIILAFLPIVKRPKGELSKTTDSESLTSPTQEQAKDLAETSPEQSNKTDPASATQESDSGTDQPGFFGKIFGKKSAETDSQQSAGTSVRVKGVSPEGRTGSVTGNKEQKTEEVAEMTVGEEVQIQEETDGCKTVAFKHKTISSHANGEACTHHKNLLLLSKLTSRKINRKSICIRVNGTPVHHRFIKGSDDKIVIDSVAGPRAEITAQFCTGKSKCKEDCKVPRDEFLDALGASDEKDYARWDENGPSKTEVELEKELRELNADLARRGKQQVQLFRGWVRGQAKVSCENKVAKR